MCNVHGIQNVTELDDEESGNFSLYQKTNDSYDQIGKFKYNRKSGNFLPKIKKDGTIKTYSNHLGNNNKIAKGILRDGLNIKNRGGVFISDDTNGPTINDFYNFALILDRIAGVEVSGYVLDPPSGGNKGIIYFEAYKNNSYDKSNNFPYRSFGVNEVLQHFHTHGSAHTVTEATQPSEDFDMSFKTKITKLYPNIQLYILHNYGKPIKY